MICGTNIFVLILTMQLLTDLIQKLLSLCFPAAFVEFTYAEISGKIIIRMISQSDCTAASAALTQIFAFGAIGIMIHKIADRVTHRLRIE